MSVGRGSIRSEPSRWRRRVSSVVTALWLLAVSLIASGLGWAWLAGWKLEAIATPSMEPTVPRQSLAVLVPVPAREVREGDVISFRHPSNRASGILHRVIEVVDRRESRAAGVFFRTQGDANKTPDPLLVDAGDVGGRMRWHVPKLGAVAWALRPPVGLAIFVGLPGISLILSEIRRRLRRGRDDRGPDGRAPSIDRSEAELLACM